MNQRIALICLTTLLLGVSLTMAKEDKEKTYSKNRTDKSIKVNGKDMTRKSIVFDKDTPDVFYCIPNKPTGEDKIIVRARPLYKLCEFEGQQIPDDYKSDCYKDVDESDYACKEKYRIMMRMYPPGSDAPYNGTKLVKFYL